MLIRSWRIGTAKPSPVLVGAFILMLATVAACADPPAGAPTTSVASPTTIQTRAPRPTPAAGANCIRPGESVVHFPNGAGVQLPGVVFGTGRTGIVFGHQTDGSICQWIDEARAYARRGYRTFVFDFTGYASAIRLGDPRPGLDVAAAADYLRRLGVTRVVLLGASLGGGAVVAASPTTSVPVAAVVSLSGNREAWGADVIAAAAQLKAPLLCVASKRDQGGNFAQAATELCTPRASAHRQLLIVDGSLHGVDLFRTAPSVRTAVDAFLARYAPPQ